MNEMVNLASEQLSESKDQPEMQMDYTGMGKVFDSSGCGRTKFWSWGKLHYLQIERLGWKDALWGCKSTEEKCGANGEISRQSPGK